MPLELYLSNPHVNTLQSNYKFLIDIPPKASTAIS